MHDPKFLKLEGSWRGLHYLVQNSETGTALKMRVLNMTKRELDRDLSRAIEFDQSQLFKKIYENEFGTPGGEPYGALIGDYEWTNHPDDIETLRLMSNIAAGAFAPFISAAGAGMFGFDDWTELSKPRDLAKIFDTVEYAKWRAFRDSEDSRFVNLVHAARDRPPALRQEHQADRRVRLRGSAGRCPRQGARRWTTNHYCWMNAAYVMGARLTDAFAQTGFCTAIRGAEGGGKVENLPTHVFTSDDGDLDAKCPTEIGITDRREFELSNLGFLPLCHYKNTDYAVFFGGQTTQKPKKYDRPEATANAAISARLPYIMATSRFAHYLKVMARDKIGSFMEASNCRDLAQSLDPELRQLQRERGPGHEGALPAARGAGRGEGDPGQAGLVQCHRLSAALAADGGADHELAHGREHPPEGLTARTCFDLAPAAMHGRDRHTMGEEATIAAPHGAGAAAASATARAGAGRPVLRPAAQRRRRRARSLPPRQAGLR